MPFPLLRLLPGILKTVGNVTGLDVVKNAAEALAGAQLSPEQEATLQAELGRHQEAMKALSVEELKTVVSESVAMIQSEDHFVSRARPMMLYAATGVTIALCLAVGYAIMTAKPMDLGVFAAISSLLVPLWGAGGYYMGKRTEEKVAALENGK